MDGTIESVARELVRLAWKFKPGEEIKPWPYDI